MIEIIKQGIVRRYQTECSHCRCVFRYIEADVQEYTNASGFKLCLACPNCTWGVEHNESNLIPTENEH